MRDSRSLRDATLGPLCLKVGSGITPRGGASVYVDSGTALIRSQNVYNTDFAYDGLALITDRTAEIMKGVSIESGDILLNITGDSVARCCQVPDDVLPARVNQHVSIIRPDQSKLHPRFLMYFLVSPLMQATMLSLAGSGGTRKALTKTMIERFQVPLPDLSEQRKIAGLLSAYDDLIENNRRRIALLEQAVRELYREWFARLRFPGHENTRIVNGLPEEWELKTLREVAVTNAQSYHAKKLPETLNYIDISSVSAGRILEKRSMIAADAPGRARRKAAHGDVIWSNVRPNLKAYSLVLDPEENDVFSTGFTVLSATRIPFTFLFQSVTSDYFVTYLVNHTTGASYPAVRPDDFERAEIVVPRPLLLTKFHEICESKYHLIANLAKEDEQLMKARDLLLPRLMSGEVTV